MSNFTIPPIISSSGNPHLDGQGYFVAGTQALFFYSFPDINGNLYDPSNIDAVITDPNGDVALTKTDLDKMDSGQYAFTWDIPTTATTGMYNITLTYIYETIDGPETGTLSENFVVGEYINGTAINIRSLAMRRYLESLIGYSQRIRVDDEIVRLNKARNLGELSFPRWNQPAGAKVYLNGELKESGYTIDYLNGKIAFAQALSEYDEVTCSYNFRWFKDDELDNFVEQGVNYYNVFPPFTYETIHNFTFVWAPAIFYSAAVDAIRRWMTDILFQEPAKIFGGMERAQQIFGSMDTLKKNYEDSRTKLLEQKKRGPYPQMATITVPEYTLPGGRSRWMRYMFK